MTNEYTASSLAAPAGLGDANGEASPRCTDSHADQSCRLVRSQKSTAYDGSNPGDSTASGANDQEQLIRVLSAAWGTSTCVMM